MNNPVIQIHTASISRINAEYAQTIEAISNAAVVIGKMLLELKSTTAHGEWGKLTGEADGYESVFRFSARAAQQFMQIAGDTRLSNPKHASDLPPSWYTQYELTKLDDDQFNAMLDDGTINPEMERADISAWGSSDVIATKHTGDEESYTPQQFIESARKVMGSIDLDPASNDMAQEIVKAGVYHTIDDDGLTKEWAGNVWMNPPYTSLIINKFINKIVEHYQACEISQAIVLTNNNTDTSWFHAGMKSAAAVCLTSGRINFIKRDGSTSSPTNGQLFFYFGSNVEAFKQEFSQHGMIMVKA